MTNNGFKPNEEKPSSRVPGSNGSKERLNKDNDRPKDPSKQYSSDADTSYNQNKQKGSSQDDRYKKSYDDIEGKVKDTLRGFKDSNFYHYASSNKEQTVSYILLALGILFLFINFFFGALLVGLVAGYHFSYQIVYFLRNLGQIFEGENQLKYIVLTGTLITLFIGVPSLFIAALIVALLKELVFNKNESDKK